MGLTWKQEHLDLILVPSGLLIMVGYHMLHLHRCLKSPLTTVIGYENYNKRAWVQRFLQIEAKERGQAIAVIGSNISAATSLASMSLALSSLIGALIGSSYHNDYVTNSIYGNTSPTIVYVKYIALLSCFLVAFACFVQTTRSFIHANFLISLPNCHMPVDVVQTAVVAASNFWVVGLRALYFATNLLLWIFGPIPMFVSSLVTVALLQYVDNNSSPPPKYDNHNKTITTKGNPEQSNTTTSPNGGTSHSLMNHV